MRTMSDQDAAMPARCLDALADLHHEVSVAMGCIARNALGDFELSLWRQELLCAGLKRAIVEVTPSRLDKRTRERLRELGMALRNQAQGYEVLVRECNKATAILRDLCLLYGHAKGISQISNLPSLSCEA